MTLEIILSASHILLIMGWVSFLAAQTALSHADWMNAAVLRRLMRLDFYAWLCALLLLMSGVLRLYFGMKGWEFFVTQWALYLKLTVFGLLLLIEFWVTLQYRLWWHAREDGTSLPDVQHIRNVRKALMLQTHLMIALPILGAMLSRGVF